MSRLAAVEGDLETVAGLQGQLEDLETLNQLALEEDDDSVATELTQGLAILAAAIEDLEVLALLGGEFDDRDAIVTIHPGAGGTESQDWAEMLWRMLTRWAERRGFKVTVNDYQEGDEAGIKSVTLTLEGPRAYGLVSAETGTHRLVRISPYDQAKRRHTSFAAVDAIPVLEDDDAPEIDDADLRIDIYRSSGPGGQGVNTTDSAVRVTHLPTGIVVAVQNERSQLANKTIALKILAARLAERARKEREAQTRRSPSRSWPPGWPSGPARNGRPSWPRCAATAATSPSAARSAPTCSTPTRWSRTYVPVTRSATPRRSSTATSTRSSRPASAGRSGRTRPPPRTRQMPRTRRPPRTRPPRRAEHDRAGCRAHRSQPLLAARWRPGGRPGHVGVVGGRPRPGG
ncbi:MAG: peptide chain release factor 2, partial [Actinomycetia bacterium]|nr:peptide chain release factor 2 [Actinomycetes bacterium]